MPPKPPVGAAAASRFTQNIPRATQPISPSLRTAKTPSQTPTPATTASTASTVVGTETPAQKVARLRAAHLAKRASEISTWDKVVVRGREVADTAHRWTVRTIVVASIILIGVTGYTLADMVRYNRAKKRQFYADQSELLKKRFLDAMEAEAKGTATEDQMELLAEERALAVAAEAKKQKPGIWKRTKDFVLNALDANLSKEDRKFGQRRRVILERIEEHEQKVADGTFAETISPTLHTIQEKRREVEDKLVQAGQSGPLDRLAESAVAKAETTAETATKSWSSWLGWK